MYFDLRLWSFTKGVRGRIYGAVAIGILAVLFGIARLALLGWLIAQVFKGVPLDELILPFVGVGAVMIVRGWLEYLRTMVAHNTAAKVQLHLRTVIFDKVTELGPAHFGLERTGDAILAMIDGVEQLEIYFGQYLPQLIVSGLTPVMIFGAGGVPRRAGGLGDACGCARDAYRTADISWLGQEKQPLPFPLV